MIEYRPESRGTHGPRDYRALRHFVLIVAVLSLGAWMLSMFRPDVHVPSLGGIILMVATLYIFIRWVVQKGHEGRPPD
jgi:hypothetical protein